MVYLRRFPTRTVLWILLVCGSAFVWRSHRLLVMEYEQSSSQMSVPWPLKVWTVPEVTSVKTANSVESRQTLISRNGGTQGAVYSRHRHVLTPSQGLVTSQPSYSVEKRRMLSSSSGGTQGAAYNQPSHVLTHNEGPVTSHSSFLVDKRQRLTARSGGTQGAVYNRPYHVLTPSQRPEETSHSRYSVDKRLRLSFRNGGTQRTVYGGPSDGLTPNQGPVTSQFRYSIEKRLMQSSSSGGTRGAVYSRPTHVVTPSQGPATSLFRYSVEKRLTVSSRGGGTQGAVYSRPGHVLTLSQGLVTSHFSFSAEQRRTQSSRSGGTQDAVHSIPSHVLPPSQRPVASRPSQQPSLVKILYWSYQTWKHFLPDPSLTGTISCKRSGVRFIEVDANLSSRDERERALSEADVVVFMLDFLLPNADLNIPKKRRKEVVYILASMESPALGFRKHLRTHPFLDSFNFLWSYNRDLNLHTSYLPRSFLYWHHVQRPALVPFAKKIKSALMMTLISNCQHAHEAIGRKSLLLRLMKDISIHNYGKCLKNRQLPSKPIC